MKTSLFAFGALAGAILLSPAHASHMFANGITTNNIIAIQHSVMHTAFQSFEGSMASTMGHRTKKSASTPATNPNLYGQMPMYGEYGDDGSVFSGRNGGDTQPVLNGVWMGWRHFGDDVKLDNVERLDSHYDLAMLGVSGGRMNMGDGITEWGAYAGYFAGTQENSSVSIEEQGGYAGIYAGYNLQNFNLSASFNGGVASNNADSTFGTDEFSNLWAGGAVNATYNIAIDDTFTLQPGLYAGYTWIQSGNYTSVSGDHVSSDNLNVFEISPALRAIKQISNGWFGSAHVRYVATTVNGGDSVINSTPAIEFDSDNFTEYGLTIEKSIDRFNIMATITRRDGARDGFGGGLNLRYIF